MFRVIFLILFIGLVSNAVFAQATFAPGDPKNTSEQPISEPVVYKSKSKKNKKHNFDIGIDLRHYEYEEPGFVKHSGYLPGIWIDFFFDLDWVMFGYDSVLSYSNALNYDGSICDKNAPSNCTPFSTSNQQDLITKSSIYIYIPASDQFRFKIGAGSRYLIDSVPEPGFYLRTGVWFYVPVGLEILDDANSTYKWKYSVGYDQIVAGGIKSNLSEADSTYSDVYMDQKGYGTNFNVELRYQIRYVISLFYETWNLNISDDVVTAGRVFHEPANQSRVIGMKFGYDFY